MIHCIIFLFIVFITFSKLTKYTNQVFDIYEKNLKYKNETIPFEFYLNRTKDFYYKIENKVIKQYNVTKDITHLIFLLWINIISEVSAYLLLISFAFALLYCFVNILWLEIETMIEKFLIIALIDFVIAFILIFLLYFSFTKHYKEYKNQKVFYLNYLKNINDIKTMSLVNSFTLFSTKLMGLMKRYSETKDDKHLMFAINYFSMYRNFIYILLVFIFVFFVNLFYFLH